MDEDESEEITTGAMVVSQKKVSSSVTASAKITNASTTQRIQTVSNTQQSSVRATYKSQTSKQYLSQSAQSSIAEEDLDETGTTVIPKCQIITQEASGDSDSYSDENAKNLSNLTSRPRVTKERFRILSKSAQNSSSSQEEYENDMRCLSATKSAQTSAGSSTQYLSADAHVEATRSMESLRISGTTQTHHRGSFLTSSERDVRRLISTSVDAKSLESLERDSKFKRRAISGEEAGLGITTSQEESSITAEKRRGLFASSDRRTHKVPQHLSLPPPGGYHSSLSPGDRRLTILSPHSPHHTPDLLQFSQTTYTTLKTRRKKAIVLPRLVLPRSDSEVSSDVFFDHDLS